MGISDAGRRPRVFYAAGPGDVAGTFRHWQTGRDDPNELAHTYSGQFFAACRDRGLAALVVASHPRPDRTTDDQIVVVHRPDPSRGARGVWYHARQAWHVTRLTVAALRYRADVAVVMDVTHWYLLTVLAVCGVRVVPSLHCTLWPKYRRPSGLQGRLQRLNGWFFARHATATLCVSDDVAAQVRDATGGRAANLLVFRPTYRKGAVAATPPALAGPRRVVYAGRVVRNKGVYGLVSISERFRALGRDDIQFDVCGDGPDASGMLRQTERAGVRNRFRFHGRLRGNALARVYGDSYALIVPTTTDFCEGFNKVVAEGVLAGRPVVTSDVCPAAGQLAGGVVTVPPDDVAAYADALLRLADDPRYYDQQCKACERAGETLLDPAYSWQAAFERALGAIGLGDARSRPG